MPVSTGGRGCSGWEIRSLRTCLHLCDFYFPCYKAERKPRGNKVPFKSANLSMLDKMVTAAGRRPRERGRGAGGKGRGHYPHPRSEQDQSEEAGRRMEPRRPEPQHTDLGDQRAPDAVLSPDALCRCELGCVLRGVSGFLSVKWVDDNIHFLDASFFNEVIFLNIYFYLEDRESQKDLPSACLFLRYS